MHTEQLRAIIERWRTDPGSTYQTWFLWDERLKNFRSIRRGIAEVIAQITAGTFGTAYKGSSLETVVGSIAEQRQIFKGADHAFLWKPKLRIPDIYEHRDNQLAFGRFLDSCTCCTGEEQILSSIRRLDECRIKGLGPAAANILYFLHPTLAVPFNTAIVAGYNALTGSRVKLGRWDDYLAMRSGVLRLNSEYRNLFSNDLGAVAGFLFDIGTGRYPLPPADGDATAEETWRADLARVREESAKERKALEAGREQDRTHTEVQGWLRDLGLALGFDVWVAVNDRARLLGNGRLADGCIETLPTELAQIDSVPLIDIIWIERRGHTAAAAFEVEHTTSIYSGIVRLLDLASSAPACAMNGLYLVAPDAREEDVKKQLARPAFRRINELSVKYLAYSDLERNRDSMARFGTGMKAMDAIVKRQGKLTPKRQNS